MAKRKELPTNSYELEDFFDSYLKKGTFSVCEDLAQQMLPTLIGNKRQSQFGKLAVENFEKMSREEFTDWVVK